MNNNESDELVGSIYEEAKLLLQQKNFREARKYLQTQDFQQIWSNLLQHAMLKHNCPITKLVIGEVIKSRFQTPTEIQLIVSQADRAAEIDFNFGKRLDNYVNSQEFDAKYKAYQEVRAAAANGLRGGLGLNILHPKDL